LGGAFLREVDFYRAIYDSSTKFPSGFDPRAEYMIPVDEDEET
jgi:hypothetical protein